LHSALPQEFLQVYRVDPSIAVACAWRMALVRHKREPQPVCHAACAAFKSMPGGEHHAARLARARARREAHRREA